MASKLAQKTSDEVIHWKITVVGTPLKSFARLRFGEKEYSIHLLRYDPMPFSVRKMFDPPVHTPDRMTTVSRIVTDVEPVVIEAQDIEGVWIEREVRIIENEDGSATAIICRDDERNLKRLAIST